MDPNTEQNKKIVVRFNREVIEQGNTHAFHELVSPNCVNHSALPGTSKGPDGMIYFLQQILKKGFPDVQVEILEQVAERDLVTTRKKLIATHTGDFMGIFATNKKVVIEVIDIIRLQEGKYTEHWGMSNLAEIVKQLAS
jgi:predicted SnoaL-like aldol condensation-catalyzing enzyme